MTIYCILPPNHMRAQSALLRMWIGSMMRAVVKGGLDPSRRVHFVLDEMSSIGQLDAIDDALDKYRGYGVKLQMYNCNGLPLPLMTNLCHGRFGLAFFGV